MASKWFQLAHFILCLSSIQANKAYLRNTFMDWTHVTTSFSDGSLYYGNSKVMGETLQGETEILDLFNLCPRTSEMIKQ